MNQKNDTGKEVYSWEDIDHVKPLRWPVWYAVFTLIMLLICIWWYSEGAYSVIFAFVALFVVYVMTFKKDPVNQMNTIYTWWIKIAGKFIAYSDIHSFWFISYDNLDLLHIKIKSTFHPVLVVPVINWNSDTIRELFIWRKVHEIENMTENLEEILARILKL